MAAESVKFRNRDDFIEREIVWVEAKYFDDLKCAPENRFSAACDKVYGVIISVASRTCKVVFKDGSTSYVAKDKLNLDGKARIVNTGNKDDEESKQIKVIRRMRQNAVFRGDYSLPKAFTARLPVSKAKFDDLMELCKDLTIPSAHHEFYNNLLVRGHEMMNQATLYLKTQKKSEKEYNYC